MGFGMASGMRRPSMGGLADRLLSCPLQLLGKGSFGSVYCCKRTKDRSLHVMKKISIHNMPPKERAATEQECKVLQRLRHPGIVCYEDRLEMNE
jgi:hypothetical protein